MNNLLINKEDISFNPDGTLNILNEELKAKIEEISIEPPDAQLHHVNNCQGGNCVKGCAIKLA
jgi:DNA phosphorothioation-dependent restriction protein DptG